jgi:adenylate cyclase
MATVVFLTYATKLFDNIELLLLDQNFYMRDERSAVQKEGAFTSVKINKKLNRNIMIIGIDSASLSALGTWPLNRGVYAQFLDHLRGAKPALVFFDIFFIEKSGNPEADARFTRGMREYKGKVLVDYPIKASQEEMDKADVADRWPAFFRTTFPLNDSARFLSSRYRAGDLPMPEVANNVSDMACAVIEPDADQKYRRAPMVFKFQNRLAPQIALSLARLYYDVPRDQVEFDLGKSIVLKNARVPLFDEFGEKTGEERRDVVIPVDYEAKFNINYVGYPYEFKAQSQYLSLSEALQVPAETFNNKILLVGMYDAPGTAHDIWPSPHGDMYGIEHNAFALNTILNADYLYRVPTWVNILVLLLLALLIGIFVPRMKIAVSAVFIVGLFLVNSVAGLLIFIFANRILLYFAPILLIVFGFAGIILYRLLTEEKEKAFIKKRFQNYVNANVVEELLKNPKALELGGVNKTITVMFSDVRGFTTISEALGEPQKLVNLLNEYLGAMTEIIFKYNGTLDKYVGDEIMAFWGAPVDQPDHPMLACRTALDQMWFLNHILNPKLKGEGKPLIDIGIGLNTGIMTVGNMGSKNRMDYTLMGDMVNLGARLEGTNKVYGTKIIISEFTYEVVKDQVVVRELDNIKVKGKTRPVKIFELLEVKGHDPSALFKDGFLSA